MRILFTQSDKILSKAIRGVTEEDVSHVALEFPSLGIVVHSNLLGVHIEWAENFRKHSRIMYTLERLDDPEDLKKLAACLAEYEWAPYDFGALAFAGLFLSARKYLKIPLPKSNLWQSSGMFICTEWVEYFIDMKRDSMMTPKGLYYTLLGNTSWDSI